MISHVFFKQQRKMNGIILAMSQYATTNDIALEADKKIALQKNSLGSKPILKWAGGKQQLLPQIITKVPSQFTKYIEPFFGGGAVFFAVHPQGAILSDVNPELINLYSVVKNDPLSLISRLSSLKINKDEFYKIRLLRHEDLDSVEAAARTMYLNKTCFNGLFRVNQKGQFNTPYGYPKNPNICDIQNILCASRALSKSEIILSDYKKILREHAEPGSFVYLDPPYLPIAKYSDFKRYTKDQFLEEDHIELADEVKRLQKMGCHIIINNSNHPLVYKLYSEYDIEVVPTRRNINCRGGARTGEDVLISVKPTQKKNISLRPSNDLPSQVKKFPNTRYMGSKKSLLGEIWKAASQFEFESVLDVFSGSGVVSYMFKAQGKTVYSNDYMVMNSTISKALIENNTIKLDTTDIDILFGDDSGNDFFISNTFKDIYYSNSDNKYIDRFRCNIKKLKSKSKKNLAMTALMRACLKKRPRGIFTYTGLRYDDGRKDLKISIKDHFLQAISDINNAVFSNGKKNSVSNLDAMNVGKHADIVYMDPPYYSPYSDNEYVRRYHFVEGLARDWQGVDIQEHTKTKKFKNYPTPFSSRNGAIDAFNSLFKKYQKSVIILSYSSNSLPSQEELIALMSKYKDSVEVVAIDHSYSFGNRKSKSQARNKVKEYLFIGY